MTAAHWNRRSFLGAGSAAALAPALRCHASPRETGLKVVVTGLLAPESPRPQRDGSILFVEMFGQTLSVLGADGSVRSVARFDGAPNGCARGPDGRVFVTVNAGSRFERVDGKFVWAGTRDPQGRSGLASVDLATCTSSIVVAGPHLHGPNDLVFDEAGGIYFTDTGATSADGGLPGAVYYLPWGGTQPRRLADVPLANGIVLVGRDHRKLRVASQARIVEFTIVNRGELRCDAQGQPLMRVFGTVDAGMLDSMAALRSGSMVCGTIKPGAVSEFSGSGRLLRRTQVPGEDLVTSVGFDPLRSTSAIISLTGNGCLARQEFRGEGAVPLWA